MPSSSSTSTIIQDFLTNFNSRKLLLLHNNPPLPTPPTTSPSSEPILTDNNSFDTNVVMVLSVLLCALICSLGLNSIIRCALRCSSLVSSGPAGTASPSSNRFGNTGVKKKALKTFPTLNYTSELEMATECAICLSEFGPGERLRVLPKCNHGFHVKCIDRWLTSHSSCPTCRHCLTETCQKIVESSVGDAPPVSIPAAPHRVVVRIEPLRPEGLIRNHEI